MQARSPVKRYGSVEIFAKSPGDMQMPLNATHNAHVLHGSAGLYFSNKDILA